MQLYDDVARSRHLMMIQKYGKGAAQTSHCALCGMQSLCSGVWTPGLCPPAAVLTTRLV